MKILALEPYYGGSHKAFLDGLKEHSCHNWTIIGLPDYKWKWRMRHSAITFAEQVNEIIAADEGVCRPQLMKQAVAVGGRYPHPPLENKNWDLIFCSDMLNLAEFLGLVNDPVKNLPSAVYFHENQLTYPVQNPDERDLHLAMINFTSCLAATEVWFNSKFHRTSFLKALEKFLKRMPDYQHVEKIQEVKNKSSVVYPGIETLPKKATRESGPIKILWAARWEYDKDPETFFKAIRILKAKNIDFRLSVIGPQFSKVPDIFKKAEEEFADKIDHWGYQNTREDYIKVLQNADVVVSTAKHEFFGISMIEAVTAGAYPLLPQRLAYPETLGNTGMDDFFYDGSTENLAEKLENLITLIVNQPNQYKKLSHRAALAVEIFQWKKAIIDIDTKLISILPR